VKELRRALQIGGGLRRHATQYIKNY
jgi:hypothetical protein